MVSMHVISNVINNHSSLRKSIICQINILSTLNTLIHYVNKNAVNKKVQYSKNCFKIPNSKVNFEK